MKVIIMRARDWWKVKYIEGQEKVVTADPKQIGLILRGLWVGGKVSMDEKGISVLSGGVASDVNSNPLVDAITSGDEFVDEIDVQMARNRILKYMRESKNARHAVRSTTEIHDAILKKWIVKRMVVTSAIQELYANGSLKLVRTTKRGFSYWQI